MNWFKNLTTINKFMFVGVPLLFLVSGVLVIVGVVTHTEAGVLTACPDNDRYDYSEDCAEVRWNRNQFPLQVYASTVNPNPPSDPATMVRGVIHLTNSRLGFPALAYTVDADSADIIVDVGIAQEVGQNDRSWMADANGAASHSRTEEGLRCQVVTWNTGTSELLQKVLTHEIWHCLGLAHDDFRDSGMYHLVIQDTTRPTYLRMTDYDRGLLRSFYR